MRAFGVAMLLTLAGCGVANHHPPVGLWDAPAIEFRNEAGVSRYCSIPNAPGMFAEANFRSCREGLLADGYREVGPWCGGNGAPSEGEAAATVAASALTGGIVGAIGASRLMTARREHAEACQRRAAGAS